MPLEARLYVTHLLCEVSFGGAVAVEQVVRIHQLSTHVHLGNHRQNLVASYTVESPIKDPPRKGPPLITS